MQVWARYIIFVFGTIICLHFILQIIREDYGQATSLTIITSHFDTKFRPVADLLKEEGLFNNTTDTTDTSLPPSQQPPSLTTVTTSSSSYSSQPIASPSPTAHRKANATFVILARNSDLKGVVGSVREIEDRFNRDYGYPYVFLNEEPFSDEFKERVSVLSASKMEFGIIPHDHWFQPDWIDEDRAKEGRENLVSQGIIYGDSVPYRNMCRFNSGFFFKHELLQNYRWYWRIEPDVHFYCNVNYDPFLYMEERNKTYGFTITLKEYQQTIPSLWGHVRDFMVKNPQYISSNHAMDFLSDDRGQSYNMCHFWSNFEIADLDFWRGEAYTAFFNYLDSQGGFYYERWGDAPVHSIAAGLLLPKDQIHFFNDIGYEHSPFHHCPRDFETWSKNRCSCDRTQSFDYSYFSCLRQWEGIF